VENKLKNKTITVTGGFGFIGCFLVERLLEYNVKKIIIIDNQKYSRDNSIFRLNDKIIVHKVSLNNVSIEKLVELLKGTHFLFHLAAEKYNQSINDPLNLLKTNVIGTTALLEASLIVGIKKVVFSSSLYAYGRRNLPAMVEIEKSNPTTIYGISKLAGEHILSHYSGHGLEYNVLRYFFVYGPRQYAGLGYKSVIIKNFQRMLSGKPPIVLGDGLQALDYSFVTDIVTGTISAMVMNVRSEIINLGSGNAITINELTNKMKVIAGYSGNSIYADSDETFGTARVCDNNKAVKLLCFDPKINIDKGLKITYDWMKNAEH
tara:strand:- start:611 stop:1567 length:957 start_codon:yes stop_codon:yes gene_type:complete